MCYVGEKDSESVAQMREDKVYICLRVGLEKQEGKYESETVQSPRKTHGVKERQEEGEVLIRRLLLTTKRRRLQRRKKGDVTVEFNKGKP